MAGGHPKTDEGETYADLCTKDLDGETCEQPYRGVTRFWGNDFETYQVGARTRMMHQDRDARSFSIQ